MISPNYFTVVDPLAEVPLFEVIFQVEVASGAFIFSGEEAVPAKRSVGYLAESFASISSAR